MTFTYWETALSGQFRNIMCTTQGRKLRLQSTHDILKLKFIDADVRGSHLSGIVNKNENVFIQIECSIIFCLRSKMEGK